MFIWHLLRTDLVGAIALTLALVTVLWCLRMLRLQHTQAERYMMCLLGLIGIYQGLHILEKAGVYSISAHLPGLRGAVDITVAALSLLSIIVLRMASKDSHQTRIQLRMAEANQASAGPKSFGPYAHGETIAVLGVDSAGLINRWPQSSEDLLGWRSEEVLRTQLPFQNGVGAGASSPQLLRLRSKAGREIELLVWIVAIPGKDDKLILAYEDRPAPEPQAVPRLNRRPTLSRPELSATG